METIAPRKRIEYIDALRGFAMLLVIFGHVELFGLDIKIEDSVIFTMIVRFHMPLFFFISGFFAYNAKKIWDGKTALAATKKKLLILIVPTLVLGLLYTYLVDFNDIFAFLESPDKLGYWFTISLLEMFLLYYGINYLVHKTVSAPRQKIFTVGILALTAIVIALVPVGHLQSWSPEIVGKIIDLFCAGLTFHFFQFFVLGNIAAAYLPSFNKLLDNKYFSGGLIISFFSAFIVYKAMSFDFSGEGILPLKFADRNYRPLRIFCDVICNYSGLLLVFAFFRKYQASFTSSTRLGASLQYIGRRTLDIYLLHYFFIPQLTFIGDFFKESPNILLELCCGLTLSLLLAGFCLLISNIIRVSDLLGHYLFGAKIAPKP